uniref:PiggyBac transposable element-derived protein domain-containing protein n=1 Tax=Oreochromis aureus TaxID=47969 RepID=A0AAZ1X7K9_OREAU
SDFGPELDSDSDSDELYQPHESDGGAEDSDSSNHSSSDEDVPFAETASVQMEPNRAAKTYKWRKKGFELPDDATTDTPLVYFRRFVSLDVLENIVEHTNQYSIQKHGKCVDTSVKEIEQVLGLYLWMGLVQMSGVRQYWENEVRYGPVADIMSRNRFSQLLSVIHFVDNEMASEEVKKDRLWKLRPFLDSFRRQCLTIALHQKQSIDEMMVPYKGKFGGIRQYIKGKPHPWGFKVWGSCCVTGFLHDFDIYQGKGVGGDIVVKLCDSLADKVRFLIFADNFFTSMPLIEKLLAKGIYYTGTVRKNRMSKCTLMTNKDLSKKGRGSYDHRIESNTNTVCLKWQDTKAVTLMSTYAGPEPLGKARRVDMLEAHLARCKFPIRIRRWYMILFWHFLSVAVINAWLLYQHDCEAQGIPTLKVLKLRKFQVLVAEGLVQVGTLIKCFYVQRLTNYHICI